MTVLEPDYEADPERRRAWTAPQDVHDIVAAELGGPALDIACGEGRLAKRLRPSVAWIGVDSSRNQLAECPYRPLVRGDMRVLPFPRDCFAEVMHLWCLYHIANPLEAIAEAKRVLRPGGRYYACTSARDNDPEIMPEGYPRGTFDAEEALDLVQEVFTGAEAQRWDAQFFPLETREDVRNYCRHNYIPAERAETAVLPLRLTKRGVLVRATKSR